MNNMVTKLSSVAALLGVIGAIGAGFVQYGKLTAKIEELDKRKAIINETVDLSKVNADISSVLLKVSDLEVELIDRIEVGDTAVEAKIKPQDLTGILKSIQEVREQVAGLNIPKATNLKPLNKAIKELENKIAELSKQTAIVSKENELQDILIEEIKTKANNPLAN